MGLLEKLQIFHGSLYSESTGWNKDYLCCNLCKTQNKMEKKTRHWANGLCRSCYRRLSVTHRLYNDTWVKENLKTISTRKQATVKKDYKILKKDLVFSQEDILSLLIRYDFRCAYCKTVLQVYDYKKSNAFQVEYRIVEGIPSLVPICRTCNCSKKNTLSDEKLQRWAKERGIPFPFTFINPSK